MFGQKQVVSTDDKVNMSLGNKPSQMNLLNIFCCINNCLFKLQMT